MSVPSTPALEPSRNAPFVTESRGPLRHAPAPTALGVFTLVADDTALTAVHYPGQAPSSEGAWGTPVRAHEHQVLGPAATQLAEYVLGSRRTFDLPLRPAGTPFQRDAWAALLAIPYGATRSYREQAEALGRPSAVRAVGAANGRNPIPVVIPCHRVIGAGGALTGYAGGTALKRALLDLESGVRTLPSG
ncbi:MAG: methylated-DNA--[protein]-cysteine S-methyltransferase [Dermatophilaceae bacterium]